MRDDIPIYFASGLPERDRVLAWALAGYDSGAGVYGPGDETWTEWDVQVAEFRRWVQENASLLADVLAESEVGVSGSPEETA